MNSINHIFRRISLNEKLLFSYWGLVVISVILSITSESFLPLIIPPGILLLMLVLTRIELVFLLLFISIPIASEVQVTSNLGTDLPSEPLMWLLFGVLLIFLAHKDGIRDSIVFKHSMTWLIALHIGWIFFTFIFSDHPIISLKFFLSKLWYVGVFYLLAYYFLNSRKKLDRIIWATFFSLLFTVLIIVIRHGIEGGFTFATINNVVSPFYRNKVTYSSLIALFLPLIWYLSGNFQKGSFRRRFLLFSIIFLLVALYFGYTRATMIAVIVAISTPLLLKWRLIKIALVIAVLGAGLITHYFSSNDQYLNYAPNYETTVMHQDFDNLLEATYQFEDISTMERFYRWIAGFYMVAEKPLTGYGPNSFYESYQPYTVRSYETYVSDNPEQSGIHNYFLMMMVEQGIPGFLIFFAICVTFLLRAENLYHHLKRGPNRRLLVGITASMIIILLLQLMNDMIETDKVGTFFWLWLAVLVKIEWEWSKESALNETAQK